MNKEFRLKQLRRWVAQSPEDASEYLAAVAAGLEVFRRRTLQHRDTVALAGLASLCVVGHPLKYAPGGSAFLLDAVLFACPQGRESNTAPAIHDLWNTFIEWARRDFERGHGFTRTWMESTRPGGVAWFEAHVIPCGVAWAPENTERKQGGQDGR